MVEDGEDVNTTIKREFFEEAVNHKSTKEVRCFLRCNSLSVPSQKRGLLVLTQERAVLEAIFADGPHKKIIFQGYSDDSRNTDNAWVETTAAVYFITEEQVYLRASSCLVCFLIFLFSHEFSFVLCRIALPSNQRRRSL